MPYKKPEFFDNEIYHIYNRGVEKRTIFEHESDYYRFIFALYECNNSDAVRVSQRIIDRRQRLQGDTLQSREIMVEILAFCLMPNHYHLVIRQLVDGGITNFMKKLGNSYVGYFNENHQRKGLGSLFQGPFKAVHVTNNNQFFNLVSYVFANPIGVLEPGWKENGVANVQDAIEFLSSYRWSSYLDSIGVKNFPSVSNRDFLLTVFGECDFVEDEKSFCSKGYNNIKKNVEGWISSKSNLASGLNEISDLLL
jgi:putative transposase